MIWVLLEIVVPLFLAFAIGVFIGWLLFRWRRRPIHASEWNQLATNAQKAEMRAATERAAYEEANNERTLLSSRVTALTSDLDSTKIELGATTESRAALALELDALRTEASSVRAESKIEIARLQARAASLEREIEERDTELEQARSELDEARARDEQQQRDLESGAAVSTVESTSVTDAEARAAELEAALVAARTELDRSQSRIADFDAMLATSRVDLAAAQELVGDLEARLDEHDAVTTEAPGEILLATAADDHVDDLKVIRGIGPRMEELLNGLGITSWEKLANLDSRGVAAVDGALGEFPGRIERDEWVEQAQALVRQFPDVDDRPSHRTFSNQTKDDTLFL